MRKYVYVIVFVKSVVCCVEVNICEGFFIVYLFLFFSLVIFISRVKGVVIALAGLHRPHILCLSFYVLVKRGGKLPPHLIALLQKDTNTVTQVSNTVTHTAVYGTRFWYI